MDMQVRDLIALDHHADALTVEGLLLSTSHLATDGHEMVQQVLVRVDPVRDLFPGYDHGVALGHRRHIEECNAQVVLVDESARNLSVDDLGEDGGHVSFLLADPMITLIR